jgi:tetratricopeptide (TPR) repeat protein
MGHAMAKTTDLAFLRMNGELKLVPAERVDAALETQRADLARGIERRLVDILQEQGHLDAAAVARLREPAQELSIDIPTLGKDSPHTMLGLQQIEPPPAALDGPAAPGGDGIIRPTTTGRRPPDVEEAGRHRAPGREAREHHGRHEAVRVRDRLRHGEGTERDAAARALDHGDGDGDAAVHVAGAGAGETRHVDARSDVYSLGATLYALLAGRPPFTGDNIARLLSAVLESKPRPLSRFNSAVSPELESVLNRAMAKDPAARHPSAAALADDLERLLREGRYVGSYGLANALAQASRDWAVPRIVRGAARLRLGQLQDAWAELRDAAQADPRAMVAAAAVWLRLAEGQRRAGQSASAEATRASELARGALAIHPEHAEARALAGAARLAQAEEDPRALDEAMRELSAAIAAVPGFARARAARATVHYLRGDLPSALTDLDEALAAVPGLSSARYLRGVARYTAGRSAEAAEDWRRVAREAPGLDPAIDAWIGRAEERSK